jgi:hypothetical protein
VAAAHELVLVVVRSNPTSGVPPSGTGRGSSSPYVARPSSSAANRAARASGSSGVTSSVIVTYPRVKTGRPEFVPAATSISNVWPSRPPGRNGVKRPISLA